MRRRFAGSLSGLDSESLAEVRSRCQTVGGTPTEEAAAGKYRASKCEDHERGGNCRQRVKSNPTMYVYDHQTIEQRVPEVLHGSFRRDMSVG